MNCACGRLATTRFDSVPMCEFCALWWTGKYGQEVIRKMHEDMVRRLSDSVAVIDNRVEPPADGKGGYIHVPRIPK